MKNLIKLICVLCVLLCVQSVSAQAPTTVPEPHTGGGMPDMGKTGVIEGTAFTMNDKGQETPVSGQEITMLIFNNGQEVLTLKKITDEKGFFTFKNIFQNQDFAYAFGTVYESGFYVFPRLSLGTDENVKKIDFRIGAGSPYVIDPATMGMNPSGEANPMMESSGVGAPMMGAGGEEKPDHDEHDNAWGQNYQYTAIGLGVLVAIVAAYFAGKKSS